MTMDVGENEARRRCFPRRPIGRATRRISTTRAQEHNPRMQDSGVGITQTLPGSVAATTTPNQGTAPPPGISDVEMSDQWVTPFPGGGGGRDDR